MSSSFLGIGLGGLGPGPGGNGGLGPGPGGNGGLGPGPVSYTHLDVYKRQMLNM